jgi:hypothetical protein
MSRLTRFRFFHLFLLNVFFSCSETGSKNQVETEPVHHETRTDTIPPAAQTDTALYDTKIMQLSGQPDNDCC